MKNFARGVFVLLVLTVLSVSLIAAQDATPEAEAVDRTGWPETFIIGVYPGDDVAAAIAGYEPLRAYLQERLGVYTALITGTTYNTIIEAMGAGRADAMEVGPFSYLLAVEIANAEAIAVANYSTEVNLEEVPGYFSVMFTKKGSGIASIADLAGRSFSFTDPASTSGYLVPATDILTAQGFEEPAQIEEFVGELVFAGNHPASVLAVWNDTVEAGATFDANLFVQIEEAGVEVCGVGENGEWPYLEAMTRDEITAIYDACPDGSLVVFHQSPLIPETPFAIRADLPQSFKDAVQAALLDVVNNPELIMAMERYYVDPRENAGLESIDALYNPLRDIARLLQIDLRAR
jgi:phosphonate transport system substrate-binding protein